MNSTTVAPPVRRLVFRSTLVLCGAATLALAVGGPAAAQLAPLDQVQLPPVDQTVEAVQGAVEQAVSTSTQVVNETTQTVEETSSQEPGQQVTGAAGSVSADLDENKGTVQGAVVPSTTQHSEDRAGTSKNESGLGSRQTREVTVRQPLDAMGCDSMSLAAFADPDQAITVSSNEPSGRAGGPPPTQSLVPIPTENQALFLLTVAALLGMLGLATLGDRFRPVRQSLGPRLWLPDDSSRRPS
ncbi:MAG: hypothetical protein ACRDHB_00900 [Actinomycetota bacterium]